MDPSDFKITYPMINMGFFFGGKAARTYSRPLTPSDAEFKNEWSWISFSPYTSVTCR
jgi:hypothetical protein